jgi:hypothetical protein
LQNVFRDELAPVPTIVNDDFDWLLASMAGEAEIKAVRGRCHQCEVPLPDALYHLCLLAQTWQLERAGSFAVCEFE